MKLLTGRRLGQSGGELAAAVVFSLVIHVIVFSGVIILSLFVKPRVFVPPFYRVSLVDLPADAPLIQQPVPSALPMPPASVPAAASVPKAKQHAPKPQTVQKPMPASKGSMPDLAEERPKKETEAVSSAGSAVQKRQESVAVASVSQGRQATPEMQNYLIRMRFKLEQNWAPPPAPKGSKATVQFKVLRSGWVNAGDVKITETNAPFAFNQAAIRAILESSPFPPLPESFFREFEMFSVDLMEKE